MTLVSLVHATHATHAASRGVDDPDATADKVIQAANALAGEPFQAAAIGDGDVLPRHFDEPPVGELPEGPRNRLAARANHLCNGVMRHLSRNDLAVVIVGQFQE